MNAWTKLWGNTTYIYNQVKKIPARVSLINNKLVFVGKFILHTMTNNIFFSCRYYLENCLNWEMKFVISLEKLLSNAIDQNIFATKLQYNFMYQITLWFRLLHIKISWLKQIFLQNNGDTLNTLYNNIILKIDCR